jgi:hypothetical protein
VLKAIVTAAERILARDPDPVVSFRLMRDVLRLPVDSPELAHAKRAMGKSRWVREVDREQWYDGSWGRFHSQDTAARQRIPTTEVGVERALALGLDSSHAVPRKAAGYITRVLNGSVDVRDRPERNDRWPTGVRLFAASTLARMQPDAHVLDPVWRLWAEIASRTFASGAYDEEAEVLAHRDLTGASVRGSYLSLGSKYHVALLGSRAAHLPSDIEAAYVKWITRRETGIGYLDAPLWRMPDHLGKFGIDAWLTSHELLSAFPSWRRIVGDAIDWLWTHRDEDGLWDFGPRSTWSFYFPLSEDWRRKGRRAHDDSTRVLALLRKYCDSCDRNGG